MDYNNRFNQIESLLADLLRNQDKQNEILSGHTQRLDSMERTFNTGFNAMLNKMDEFIGEVKGLRSDFQRFADHEERLRKIEAVVFRKGA